MRYVYAQDTNKRFQWELDVALTNLYSLDPNADVLLLFAIDSVADDVLTHMVSNWGNKAEIHAYKDTRHTKQYVASTRPFLWYCYLSEDKSREKDTYFQIESDVIFRELPDWTKIEHSPSVWAGSDCASFLDYNYISSRKNARELLDGLTRVIGISEDVIKRTEGAGAHWLMVKPKAEYWLKVQSDCHKIYGLFATIDSDIQVWCAEMWAQLLNAPLFGADYKISKELDFTWPSHPEYTWWKVKILHNTGLAEESLNNGRCLNKSLYYDKTPFDEDLSGYDKTLAGIHYVEAVEKARAL